MDRADEELLQSDEAHTAESRGWPWRVFLIIWQIPRWLLIGVVRLYQFFLSPLFGRNCRFTPTCSNYFIQAVQKYGAVKGSLKGVWRICRCHPFSPGGFDPP